MFQLSRFVARSGKLRHQYKVEKVVCFHPIEVNIGALQYYNLINVFYTASGQSHVLMRSLSTTAVRSAEVGNWMDAPVFANEKGPERDHVNFPRRKYQRDPAPVRHIWVPVEYFNFFYQKTGAQNFENKLQLDKVSVISPSP